MKRTHTTWIVLLPLIVLLMNACGEKKQPAQQSEESEKPTTTSVTKGTIDPEAPVVEITLRATGNTMAEITYDQKELRVPAGTTVKLTMINESKDETMHHNFVLIIRGAAQQVAEAGMKLGQAGNYLPDMPEVLAGTRMLGPGDTATITFASPAAGEYQYICTYPGHYSVMNGRFFVED